MTPAEARLWTALKPLRARGFQFRRQHPFHGYFLDFVCLRARLAIEVDGVSHEVTEDWDRRRDAVLKGEGFEVLRIQNVEVRDNLEGLVPWIVERLEARTARW